MSRPFTTGMKFTTPRNFGYQMARRVSLLQHKTTGGSVKSYITRAGLERGRGTRRQTRPLGATAARGASA